MRIFASPAPEKPGFEIVAAEEPADGGAAERRPRRKPIAPAAGQRPIRSAGEAIFKKCAACHTGEKGGANKVGPNLWGIVNRPIASHEGFAYSAGMKAFSDGGKAVWDYDHLNDFLTAPEGLCQGHRDGLWRREEDRGPRRR